MKNMKKLAVATLVTLAVAASTCGLVKQNASEACCCDFADGKIVCAISGQELETCCCDQPDIELSKLRMSRRS